MGNTLLNQSQSEPKVSVIIPTYNRSHFVCDAIDTVLAQTYTNYEIIVIDDGSTDNTFEVVKKYGKTIRYYRQENKGPGAARNLGIKHCEGDLIAFLDSDDLWTIDKLEKQTAFLSRYPHIDFVFGNVAIFSDKASNDSPEIKNKEVYEYLQTNSANLQDIFNWLIIDSFIYTSTLIFKRECVDQVGLFDENLQCAEDLEFFIRCSYYYRFGFIDAVLVKRRRHQSNIINDYVLMLLSGWKVLQQTKNTFPDLSDRAEELIQNKVLEIYFDLGSHFFKMRDFADAYDFLALSMKKNLFNAKFWVKICISFLVSKCRFRRE